VRQWDTRQPIDIAIASSAGTFEYTGVDPNPVACRRFREDFEKLALPNVKLEVRTEAVESLNINESL